MEFQNQDDRLIVHNLQNDGVSKARNFSLDHIYGQYVVFLVEDDFVWQLLYYNSREFQNYQGYGSQKICYKLGEKNSYEHNGSQFGKPSKPLKRFAT